jgi:hypothetical protein
MKKIVRLTESDIVRLINKVIKEQQSGIVDDCMQILTDWNKNNPNSKITIPESCKTTDKKLECFSELKRMGARYAEPIEKFLICKSKTMSQISMNEKNNVSEQGIKPASPAGKIAPCRSLLMAGNDLKNVTIMALGKSDGELAVYQNGKLICTL